MPDRDDAHDIMRVMKELRGTGAEAPPRDRQLELLAGLRVRRPVALVDEALLGEIHRLRLGLQQASAEQQEVRALLDRLTAPPWFVGIYLGGGIAGARGLTGVVGDGTTKRIVNFADGLDATEFALGDEVLLGPERNVIVGRSPFTTSWAGDTATYDREAGTGRIVVRVQDEEHVLWVTPRLADEKLKTGDVIRWDRTHWLALEKVERCEGSRFDMGTTPAETFADIGGLDRQIEELQRVILLHYQHGDVVRRYKLHRRAAVLLAGPPGTGKTLIAKAFANWLASLSPSGASRFLSIKPGSLHSPYYSMSEAGYRSAFAAAREAGDRDQSIPVVLFFDEVDAIGAARGGLGAHIDDRVMTAFLAELDGLESRGNVLVVCATNRRDALDPALLRPGGRLGDIVLDIPRPGRSAASEIFARHLPSSIPWAPLEAGGGVREAREALLDSAVSRIFAPNGHGALATLTLRDGKRRVVTAADLVSGAAIANIARRAVEQACLREAEGGESGVKLTDMLGAIDAEFEAAANVLTPGNCARFVEGLPQDIDVVRVERSRNPGQRAYRYLSIA